MPVQLTCQQCGDEFSLPPSQSKGRKYCSQDCFTEAQKERVELECEFCGGTYKVKPSRVEAGRKYCSRTCYAKAFSETQTGEDNHRWEGGKIELTCEQCGEEYLIERNKLEGRRYCSNECQGKAQTGEGHHLWKGGCEPYYGPNWPKMRRLARTRDCFNCRHCGKSEQELDTELHVHHIKPIREFDKPENANNPTNLISLCPSCHMQIEGDRELAKELL